MRTSVFLQRHDTDSRVLPGAGLFSIDLIASVSSFNSHPFLSGSSGARAGLSAPYHSPT